jgi:hypothetical protein
MTPRFIINFLLLMVIALGFILVSIGASRSEPGIHEGHCNNEGHWYDSDCCSCDDCRPTKAGEVQAFAHKVGDIWLEGYEHTLTGKKWYRGDTDFRPSKDGSDHICWPPGWAQPKCFYEAPKG